MIAAHYLNLKNQSRYDILLYKEKKVTFLGLKGLELILFLI